MSSEESRLTAYKEKTKVDGEELVRNVFPKRVFEMEQVLASELFAHDNNAVYSEVNIPYPNGTSLSSDGGDSASPPTKRNKIAKREPTSEPAAPIHGTPVYALPDGCVAFNRHIKSMIEKTKPSLTQLMNEAQLVRLWVQFNIPRIEDGNNFGVSIQEEVLSEASSIERDACTFLDQITRYYASRGKLIGKVAKNPHIDDYRQCIRDMDEKQAITMRYIIMEIRNHYATLHDIIIKNIDRIKMPRSNNAINMY